MRKFLMLMLCVFLVSTLVISRAVASTEEAPAAPTEEVAPAEEEAPATEEVPATEEAPAEEEAPVEEEHH